MADLAPGRTYTFRVEAVNDTGFSEPSAASVEVTIESGTITIFGKRGKVRGKNGLIITGTVTGNSERIYRRGSRGGADGIGSSAPP